MSKINGVSIVAMLNNVDEGVMEAIDWVKGVIRNPAAKVSEKTAAANALIKMKTTFFTIQKQQSFDKMEYELKRIAVKTAQIKLDELVKATDPNATEKDKESYSKVFSPSMRASGIDDSVAREVL